MYERDSSVRFRFIEDVRFRFIEDVRFRFIEPDVSNVFIWTSRQYAPEMISSFKLEERTRCGCSNPRVESLKETTWNSQELSF